jgi:beta-glucosidase
LHKEANGEMGSALLDPDQLLEQLSSEEKIRLLSGDDMWHTCGVPRLNIPRVRVSYTIHPFARADGGQMSDGPNGVRGTACK